MTGMKENLPMKTHNTYADKEGKEKYYIIASDLSVKM